MSRRVMLQVAAAGTAALTGAAFGLGAAPAAAGAGTAAQAGKRTRRVGAAGISFRYTMKSWKEDAGLQFLEAAHRAGAEVAMLYPQMVDKLDADQLRKLRARAEELNVMLEVHGSDPFRPTYETTLRQSAALGVKAVGCYCGMLVRPDKAPTLEAWDAYVAKAGSRLRELEPLARRLGITIGIENHLDFTIEELFNLVKKFDSPHIGVLFDIGNGIATLDDPVAAADLLGPYIVATHYKDFAVELITRGFLFTMVPLGCGSLRLEEITRALQKRVRPGAGYSIEMMNGQQFEVKWLEDRFWVPYRNKPARDVAATLRHIRGQAINIDEMKPEKELGPPPARHLRQARIRPRPTVHRLSEEPLGEIPAGMMTARFARMKQRGSLRWLVCASLASLLWPLTVLPAAVLEGTVEHDGVFTLAPGPKVEGVVFLQGGLWQNATIKTFHEIPWVDAASVRLGWGEFELQDQQFNWEPFDRILGEVKKYNAAHPGAHRTLQIRVMGGRHCPKWFEPAGVRYYDTTHPEAKNWETPLHAPMPYDNPEFLKQLRELYRAMYDRYHDEPLVTVYHGTWSAGPWDEIFHPQGKAPLPPGYTKEKFTRGMIEQLDVLIEEFCLKGKVAELPYSGKFPDAKVIDFLGPLTRHITQRLGRRSPYLYIQSNGWGFLSGQNRATISWGHEQDMDAIRGQVNVALQALGSNAGGGWAPQGDWVPLVELAQAHAAAYTEIYEPDFRPLDVQHHIVEAFTHEPGQDASTNSSLPAYFIGYRPWLQQRRQMLYVQEGTVRFVFKSPVGAKPVTSLTAVAEVPPCCSVKYRVRTRLNRSDWSEWNNADQWPRLPAGDETEVEARLQTDDGCFSPRLRTPRLGW